MIRTTELSSQRNKIQLQEKQTILLQCLHVQDTCLLSQMFINAKKKSKEHINLIMHYYMTYVTSLKRMQ